MRNWPLFGLRVITPRVTLSLPTDDELDTLADLAAGGIHSPDAMPFHEPWSRQKAPQLQRGLLQWHWRQRASWSADQWHLPLLATSEGAVVGTQGISAEQFDIRRAVTTGSWLGREHQGRGLGKEMRWAVLHLAFAGLGALTAHTEAFIDNPASLGVTRALGYSADGERVLVREGRRVLQSWFKIDRRTWEGRKRPEVAIEGLDACRDLFGSEAAAPPLTGNR